MRGPNLSAWALNNGAMLRFLIAAAILGGIYSYSALGRQEDPEFTVKNMLVSAQWPGASAQEVADQVAKPTERAIQTLPEVDYLRTTIHPGDVVINIKLRENTPSRDVPGVWTRVRQRVSDRRGQLPEGVVGPHFHDDFGDTFGNIYAITGRDYSLPQLRKFAEQLRDKMQALNDVGRVELEGEPDERVYIEYDSAKLATLGVEPQSIINSLQETNTINSAGAIETRAERVRINVTGSFDSVAAIRQAGIAAGGRTLRLGDIATVKRGLADPPGFRFRFNGRDAIGVMVSLRKGGNITRLGEQSAAVVQSFARTLPLGIQIGTVSDQPAVVKVAIGEFTRSLAEALTIVLGVSLFSLGWRPGAVVAFSIPIVLALTFSAMFALDIPLHRVSLGALIIALGLLVDDAIIVVEQIDTHLHSGWAKVRAVVSAYEVTAQPMLIGTLITVLGFLPIAIAGSAAGEYSRAIFEVVAISLILSWLVAVFVTPFIAQYLLRESGGSVGVDAHEGADGLLHRQFRRTVEWALQHRVAVISATVVIFIVSLALFALAIPKQFFPNSDRTELVVDLRTAQNASFQQTERAAERLEGALAGDPDVSSVSSYIGGGTPRFYLSLDVQTPAVALAQVLVQTRDEAARDRVRTRIEHWIQSKFPEGRGRVSLLELGPPVGQPLKVRISGPSYAALSPAAAQVAEVFRSDRHLRDINSDYGDYLKSVRVLVDQDKARALGVTSARIQEALRTALSGRPITRYREGDQAIEVVARRDPDERLRLDRIAAVTVQTGSGRSVPLSQVARLSPSFEPAELNRRSGVPTITVQADVVGAQPDQVAASMTTAIDRIGASLPAGATITFGGILEESASSQRSVFAGVPIAFALILFLLVAQLRSLSKMLLVLTTGPLALIGVALVLSIFQIPFGFVAMLGALSLFGMVIRNSVILVSQIDMLVGEGEKLWTAIVEAAVHRLRPIMLTALAAILGMIPLTRSVFWGPMAWSIMGGLLVATLLTLIFLPALYAAAYRASPIPEEVHA